MLLNWFNYFFLVKVNLLLTKNILRDIGKSAILLISFLHPCVPLLLHEGGHSSCLSFTWKDCRHEALSCFFWTPLPDSRWDAQWPMLISFFPDTYTEQKQENFLQSIWTFPKAAEDGFWSKLGPQIHSWWFSSLGNLLATILLNNMHMP